MADNHKITEEEIEAAARGISPAFFGDAVQGWIPEHAEHMRSAARRKAKAAITAFLEVREKGEGK